MPTYTYQCEDCGHRYDAFQQMSAEPHKVCPECGGTVGRLIGAGSGIVFKGSGFYVTDYRKDGGKGKESGAGKSDKSGGDSASSGSGSSSSGSSSGASSSGSSSGGGNSASSGKSGAAASSSAKSGA